MNPEHKKTILRKISNRLFITTAKDNHPIFIYEVVNTILRQDAEMLTMADTNWHYGG